MKQAKLKRLVVGGIPFKIAHSAVLEAHDSEQRRYWLLGRVQYERRLIEISSEADAVYPIVILHESLHAILEQAGHTDQNEQHIVALGYGLARLIKENPDLVKALQEFGNEDAEEKPAPTRKPKAKQAAYKKS